MTTPTDLDRLRKDAQVAERIRNAPTALAEAEAAEAQRRRAEGLQATRQHLGSEVRAAVAAARQHQGEVPALMTEAVEAFGRVVAALADSQAAIDGAFAAARHLARVEYDAALEDERRRAEASGWDASPWGVGARFGEAFVRDRVRSAGAPEPFDGVGMNGHMPVLCEAVLVALGRYPRRLRFDGEEAGER